MGNKKSNDVGGVYCITNIIDNKKYIGESAWIYTRWYKHKTDLRKGVHSNHYLQNAWNKYGENNFIFHIVEVMENSTKESRLEREKYWTKFYNTESEDFGYNFADVQNIEKLNRKKYVKKERRYKKVIELDLNNSYIKTWESVKDLCKFFNKPYDRVRGFIWTSKRPEKLLSYRGSVFIIEDYYNKDYDYRPVANMKKIGRPIKERLPKICKTPEERNVKRNLISLQNIETQEIKHFKSIKEAEKSLGFKLQCLLKGEKDKGGGKKAIITQWKGWKIYKEV